MTPNQNFAIGIDLGGTKLLAAIIDRNGTILNRVKLPTNLKKPGDLVKLFCKAIDKLLAESGQNLSEVCAIGIGAAGLIDPDAGIILQAPNLNVLNGLDLKQPLEASYHLPVCMDNDVNIGTFGEAAIGAAQGSRDVVGIFLGTGIGGGIILNNDIYHGFTKTAGEIGHTTLNFKGRKHPLKTAPQGTLEAYAGRIAIMKRIKSLIAQGKPSVVPQLIHGNWNQLKSSVLKKALKKGDAVVEKVLSETAEYVGIGVANIAHILGPEYIVLGGGIMEAVGDFLLPRIIAIAQKRALENSLKGVKIVEAKLGDDAIILGAAMWAFKNTVWGTQTEK